jgi:hypothetical protein
MSATTPTTSVNDASNATANITSTLTTNAQPYHTLSAIVFNNPCNENRLTFTININSTSTPLSDTTTKDNAKTTGINETTTQATTLQTTQPTQLSTTIKSATIPTMSSTYFTITSTVTTTTGNGQNTDLLTSPTNSSTTPIMPANPTDNITLPNTSKPADPITLYTATQETLYHHLHLTFSGNNGLHIPQQSTKIHEDNYHIHTVMNPVNTALKMLEQYTPQHPCSPTELESNAQLDKTKVALFREVLLGRQLSQPDNRRGGVLT